MAWPSLDQLHARLPLQYRPLPERVVHHQSGLGLGVGLANNTGGAVAAAPLVPEGKLKTLFLRHVILIDRV